MTALAQALLYTLIFLCFYVIVDRICKCVETCAMTKYYCESMKVTNNNTYISKFEDGLSQTYKEMEKNGPSC